MRRAGGEPPPVAVSGRPEHRGGCHRRKKEERVPKDQIDFSKPASSVALRASPLLDIIDNNHNNNNNNNNSNSNI